MAIIDALVLVIATGFAFILVGVIVVIIGIHQEERRMTLARGAAPGRAANLARWVLDAHFSLSAPRPEDELHGNEPRPDALVGAGF